jgi:cobalt-precorrin 5A hydrolase/precorrin-3B C17-methyltransferase
MGAHTRRRSCCCNAFQKLPRTQLFISARLSDTFVGAQRFERLKEAVYNHFHAYSAHIFIMSTGIVVRLIAPLIQDKTKDPAVLVGDEKGCHIISLLSGHLGGANALAATAAGLIGAKPVITTATDICGVVAIDLLAQEKKMVIENPGAIKTISMAAICGEAIYLHDPYGLMGHDLKNMDVRPFSDESGCRHLPGVFVDDIQTSLPENMLVLRPASLVAGIGCNRNTSCTEIKAFLLEVLAQFNLAAASLKQICSIDLKADEAGLLALSKDFGLPLKFFTRQQLDTVASHRKSVRDGFKTCRSQKRMRSSRDSRSKSGPIDCAQTKNAQCHRSGGQNSLYIVGIGPGSPAHLTERAKKVLAVVDAVAGYTTYIDLIAPLIRGKTIIQTAMKKEVERVAAAVDLALSGTTCAIVSSGDPGVYAMAGLAFEICREKKIGLHTAHSEAAKSTPNDELYIEVVPGIPALCAGAALLGAPLTHDFAAISLSDLLTPWEAIEKRLAAAAAADFVIVLYNPKSKKRSWQLTKACDIIRTHRSENTPVGVVWKAMRSGQRVQITTLQNLSNLPVDMQTTVFIGNSNTFAYEDFMVTPRGYAKKYRLERDQVYV